MKKDKLRRDMEKDKLRREIGQRVRMLRKHLKLYQDAMADNLGISRSTFYRLERGEIFPSPHILVLMRAKFNVSLDWLVIGEGEMILEEREDKFDYGEDAEMIMSLLEMMHKVPIIRYAVLNFFLDYKDEHGEVIEKTLSEYDRLQGKIKNRPPLKAQGD